jgi:uncharacterized cupin superfamily protein
MFYPIIRAVCLGWLIGGSVMSGVVQAATEILSLNPASLREMTLESIPPWPDDMVLSGTNEHWQKILHEGEFVIALYEAMPATIDVAIPYTYDEYVLVLEGSVVLTFYRRCPSGVSNRRPISCASGVDGYLGNAQSFQRADHR